MLQRKLVYTVGCMILLWTGISCQGSRPTEANTTSPPRLRVAENGRFLIREDGKPFFYLGDTAWEILHRLTREEIDRYLANRASKNFTVIQVVLIPEIHGLDQPNRYGDLPLIDLDPTKPNEQYFELVDYLVQKAGQAGLYVAMLPTWGAYAVEEDHPLFEDHFIFNPDNSFTYGKYLGERYKNEPNIIWILGGDRFPEGYEDTWRAMERGITEGTGHSPLITYHPRGPGSTAMSLHHEPWLSFNMIQSGHDRDRKPYEMISFAYQRKPAKPVLNGEPGYEGIPNNLDSRQSKITADDVRRFAYWSVFAGAFGHTYGANEMWMMWTPEIEPVAEIVKPPFLNAAFPWYEAMDYPGAAQMQYLRRLIESRPMLTRIPDQDLIASENTDSTNHVRATRASDGSYAMVYIPSPSQTVEIRMDSLSGDSIRAWWYDPRNGTASSITENFASSGVTRFISPSEDTDWVLVLDDAKRSFPPPGSH